MISSAARVKKVCETSCLALSAACLGLCRAAYNILDILDPKIQLSTFVMTGGQTSMTMTPLHCPLSLYEIE